MNIQVRIIKRNGKQHAQYRNMRADGTWGKYWFKMTVSDAREALRTGTAHAGGTPNCKVYAYGN